ncbi:gamma-glutamyl-gamma-aminobutyrate hydrolase family protein [Pseudomonas sessilinigenes]|uniref:Gamma-glutamyl-gamma-aminobutyrate hydrolase family protein n=2 Tax=Pseudomonas sessilinigenes TaxID=658629 RepID=A0ABX8MVN6_9PSED|nr:gamma-glutamyl-gamma-aminobutyrate hydrolase family protein [Pseudomonas sessilinigenes]AZC23621.1 Glutamine amidotransferase, class I [Pseudomonas sessilinigenes]QXH42615.1 gamma-glutamyl-gamma-aminobutyrate hydrolase family protein [Pseudomonas sessilinigenes]
MQPVILISAARQRLAINHSAALAMNVVNCSFTELLISLGCVPLIVVPGTSIEALQHLFSIADGVLLGSGQDLCPSTYGEAPEVSYSAQVSGIGEPYKRPLMLRPDQDRDALELALYRQARSLRLPILGVCRGMQLINVAEGGTLYQEIPERGVDHCIDADGWINYHPVAVDPQSQLYRLVDKRSFNVSSVHHQAIKHLAPSLKASAMAADGLIEAVELDSHEHFVMGLQGHIEKTLNNHPENLQIWKKFASEAATRSRQHVN